MGIEIEYPLVLGDTLSCDTCTELCAYLEQLLVNEGLLT